MPNITDFDAGNLAIHPTETGVESFAAAGRRLGAFYNQRAETLARVGQEGGRAIAEAGASAVAYQDHQQINAGADHGATLFANLTDSWNQTSANADVHDPSVAQKWREEQLEPALQQFSQGFTTQKSQDWANRFINTQRQHFFTKTEADMSSMASAAVHESVTNAVTKYSNTAVSDPSSVDTSVALFKQNLDDVIAANPNIKGPDAARVRLEVAEKGVRQIVQAGAMGAILNARDPEAAAAAWAKKYPDYVSGAEEIQLAKAAKIQAKQNTLLTTQIANEQKRSAEIGMATFLNDSSSKNVTFDAQGNAHIDPQFVQDVNSITTKFSNAPTAWKQKEELGNWIKHQQDNPKGGTTDAATAAQLDARLFDTDNPTTVMDLRRAQVAGKLSNQDFSMRQGLIKERDAAPIRDPMFKYATDQAKIAIEGVTPADKAYAGGKYAAFMQSFLSEYLKQSRAGTLPPNALDLNDDKSLISQYLAPYRMDLGNLVKNNGGIGSTPVVPPPKPAPAPQPPMASM